MFQLAFTFGLMVAMGALFVHGDERDYWAGICVLMQTVLVWWQIDNLLGVALIYVLSGLTFLVFSVKLTGAALGIVSCLMALLTVAAFWGYIPHEKGQGIAFNYYHWCTVLSWGQLGILGFMSYAGNNLRHPFL